jgi:hypothetical protein
MSFSIRLVPDVLRSVAFGAIGAQLVPLGTPFTHPMRIISIKNLTNQSVFISFDGIDFNEIVPADSGIVWDFCSNQVEEAGAFISAGTQIWVADDGVTAPTSGSVYLSCFYGIEGE